MQIDRETIIKLEREAFDRPINNPSEAIDAMEHFAKLVAEHEREAIIAILKGINETEIESPDGWWETSTGAEFGASILAAIRARSNT